ncbi:hypothetical protein ACFC06_24760 [Nocardia sp. NPDC056064]|uniref:hypothetical protein n=1 Tax=Nocardia sp. NPDC056064 TaxID=3345701 RepID=UPI0035DA6E90
MKNHEPPGIPGGGENAQAWRHDEIATAFAGLDVTAAHAQADRFALLALCFADGLLAFERAIGVAAESAWSGAGASAAAQAVTAYIRQASELVAALDELPAVVRAAAEAVVSTKYAIPAVVSDAGEPAWAAGRPEPNRAASAAQDEARTAMHDRYVVPFGELSGRIPVLPTPTRPNPGEPAVPRSNDHLFANGRPRDAELYRDTSADTESKTKADSKPGDVASTDSSAGGVADVARSGTTDADSRPDISAMSSPEPNAPEESAATVTAGATTDDPTTAATTTEGSTGSTATDGPTTGSPTNASAATSGAANTGAATSGAATSGAPPDRNAVAAPASAAATGGVAGNPAVASTGYSASGALTSGPFTGGLPAGSGGWATGAGSVSGWSAAAPAPGDVGTSIARGAAVEGRPAYLGYGVRQGGDGGEATATASGAGGRPGVSPRVELPGQPAPGQPAPVRLGAGQSVAGTVIGGETPSGSAGPRAGDRHVHCPLGAGAAVAPGDDGERRVPEYLVTRGNTEALLGTPRPAIAGGVIGGDAAPDEQQQAATRDRLSCR